MLGLPAYAKVPDDPVSLGIDDINAIAAAVRHIDQRWKLTDHGAKIAGCVGRVDIALIQYGRHARQRVRGGQQEQEMQDVDQTGHNAFEMASAACFPMRMQSGMPMPV